MSSDNDLVVTGSGGYAGADWLRSDARKPMSAFGAQVADFLGWWLYGIYHAQKDVLRADWTTERFIRLTMACSGWSSFDNPQLTRLVLGAHDRAIRVDISPCNGRYVWLTFHPRERHAERMSERHPSIEYAMERHRKDAGRR